MEHQPFETIYKHKKQDNIAPAIQDNRSHAIGDNRASTIQHKEHQPFETATLHLFEKIYSFTRQ